MEEFAFIQKSTFYKNNIYLVAKEFYLTLTNITFYMFYYFKKYIIIII